MFASNPCRHMLVAFKLTMHLHRPSAEGAPSSCYTTCGCATIAVNVSQEKAYHNACSAGVVLEHVESTIKSVITEDDMLPHDCKHLQQEEWGVELADYFECVAGKALFSNCIMFMQSDDLLIYSMRSSSGLLAGTTLHQKAPTGELAECVIYVAGPAQRMLTCWQCIQLHQLRLTDVHWAFDASIRSSASV